MSGGGWVGKHKDELLTAGALGALGIATGGFGLLGAGAAEAAGAGAAAGLEGGAGAAAGGLAGTEAVGAGAGGMGLKTAMQTGLMNMMGGAPQYDAVMGGLGSLGKGAYVAQQMGLLQQPQMQGMQPPRQSQPMPNPGVNSFQQMYGQPVDEQRKRMMGYL